MAATTTDRIEKTTTINAPQGRVWRAIADAEEFGSWFGLRCDRPFAAGVEVGCTLTDPSDYAGIKFTILVDRIEPESLLSYRWHPNGIEPDVDYSKEPMTLVEFRLEPVGEQQTRLTVTETGFDSLPIARRARALESNTGGWEIQVERVRQYAESRGG
jgi:uncharacterized protein YndB with AHSA1/START domain